MKKHITVPPFALTLAALAAMACDPPGAGRLPDDVQEVADAFCDAFNECYLPAVAYEGPPCETDWPDSYRASVSAGSSCETAFLNWSECVADLQRCDEFGEYLTRDEGEAPRCAAEHTRLQEACDEIPGF